MLLFYRVKQFFPAIPAGLFEARNDAKSGRRLFVTQNATQKRKSP